MSTNNNFYETLTEGTTRFLTEYIKDSAFFVNRFMVGYTKDKLRARASMFGQSQKQIEDFVRSFKSYHPITKEFIYDLYLFYETLVNQIPSDKDIIVYRGCDTLEDHAMDGLSAASFSKTIAQNFNYGTLLEIHIPAGNRFIQCSEFVHDEEEQIVLPPCNYDILQERIEVIRGVSTRVVEITIRPKDILKVFALAMETPPRDYIDENGLGEEYQSAFLTLYQTMVRRALNSYPQELLKQARISEQDLGFPDSRKGIDAYSDIKLIEFILNMKDNPLDVVTLQIRDQFPFITASEQECLLDLITKFYEKGYPQI